MDISGRNRILKKFQTVLLLEIKSISFLYATSDIYNDLVDAKENYLASEDFIDEKILNDHSRNLEHCKRIMNDIEKEIKSSNWPFYYSMADQEWVESKGKKWKY